MIVCTGASDTGIDDSTPSHGSYSRFTVKKRKLLLIKWYFYMHKYCQKLVKSGFTEKKVKEIRMIADIFRHSSEHRCTNLDQDQMPI